MTWRASALASTLLAVSVACCSPRDAPIADGFAGDTSVAPWVVGTWQGYVENYHFASGSAQLRLEATSQDSLSLVLGSGTPPLVNQDKGFPENGTIDSLVEGFAFTGNAIQITTDRIEFTVYRTEQWDAWCKVQVSYAWSVGVYSCLPNAPGGRDASGQCWYQLPDEPIEYVDCFKFHLCSPPLVCRCDASGCRADEDLPIPFDLHRNGDALSGTTRIGVAGELHNVYLKRTE